MRRFLLITAFALCMSPLASAQLIPTANGTVTMDIVPSRVELRPEESRIVTAWVNATIQCENGYSPTTQVTVRAAPNSLEDDDGEPLWIVEPSSIALEFQRSGDRYDAKQRVDITLRAETATTQQVGTIEFEVLWAGSGAGSNDCGMFGMSWRMDGEPHIDVTLRPENETGSGQGIVDAETPAQSEPAVAIVEGGPIRGQSRIPGEAFWSLGIVFGLFASTAVYSFRKR